MSFGSWNPVSRGTFTDRDLLPKRYPDMQAMVGPVNEP